MGKYNYSVERAEFARLNADGSYPTPVDWSHVRQSDGATISHKGGLVGGVGPFDLSAEGLPLTLVLTKGKNQITLTLSLSGVVSEAAVTATELAAAINAAATTASAAITASVVTPGVGSGYSEAYLKIVDSAASPLPWYAPFGLDGKIAEIAGITGWRSTDELKTSNGSPEVETGDTVTQTSGKGNRCVIKEEDAITSMTLEVSLAASEEKILSEILGDDYDATTGEYFMKELTDETPTFAYRYWVRRYEAGTNTKSSNDQMLLTSFPNCQATVGDESVEEAAFQNGELTASATENTVSNLPIKHKKIVTYTQFSANVA